MDIGKFKKCVEIMKIHIDSGDSFTLSRTKAMRALSLTTEDSKVMSQIDEFKELKKDFKLQHRNDQSWTNKLA